MRKGVHMVHVLFLIYTAVFGASFFSWGTDLCILVGVWTGGIVLFGYLRHVALTGRGSYYVRRFLRLAVCLVCVVPYLLFSDRVAADICYTAVLGWRYVFPALRLLSLRVFYGGAVKKACRERNYKVVSTRGGMMVRMKDRVYDLRFVGALHRMGAVKFTSGTTYTIRQIPPALCDDPARLAALTEEGRETRMPARILMGRARERTIAWSNAENAERVVLFLPGLCAWKCNGPEQALTNGSTAHGVRYFGADAFIRQMRTDK